MLTIPNLIQTLPVASNDKGFELENSSSLGARHVKHLFGVVIFALLKVTYYESTLGNHFH